MQHSKRTMRHPAAFIGKRINPTKWNLPDGFARCAMTGKFHPEAALGITFAHWVFEKSFLIEHHIYVEDAEWLSQDGYDQIMDVLDTLGVLSQYREAVFNNQQQAIPLRPESPQPVVTPAPVTDDTPDWLNEITATPAPIQTARDLYAMAYRAQRQTKSTSRGDRIAADRRLSGIAAAHPAIVAAAAASFAARSASSGDRALALAVTRTQRAIADSTRYDDTMVYGRDLRADDTIRFETNPATWFTLTSVEQGIGGAFHYIGARADGTTAKGFIAGSRRIPVRRIKSVDAPLAENVIPFSFIMETTAPQSPLRATALLQESRHA